METKPNFLKISFLNRQLDTHHDLSVMPHGSNAFAAKAKISNPAGLKLGQVVTL